MSTISKIILVVMAFTWACVAQAAPRGKAFYHGAQTPQHLADIMQRNLDQHSDGTAYLSRRKCNGDGSCGTPQDYLPMINQLDSTAHITRVGQIPGYLRGLVSRKMPNKAYDMACLVPDARTASGYRPVLHCVIRHPRKGEKAWVNPKTGKMIFAQDCSNPIQGPDHPRGCVYERLQTSGVNVVRFQQLGPADVSNDKCTALLRPGETEWENGFLFRNECPDGNCNFTEADADLARLGYTEPGQKIGSFKVTKPGVTIVRLPAVFAEKDSPYRMLYCVDRKGAGGYADEHSCGMGIQWFDYVPTKNGSFVATIYADQEAAQRAGATTRLKTPTDLWWRFGLGMCY